MENHDASTEVHSTFIEPRLMEWVLKPLAKRLPHAVTPNQISLVNICFALLAFVLAAVAPGMEPNGALWARIGAGVSVWLFMVGDCLDGMHARRTGRSSTFGEFLDHWLDALGVPIVAAALIMTLELDPFSTFIGVLGAALVYNAQLIIKHDTGKFIHPPTSGVDAQFMLGVAFIGVGIVFHQLPRDGGLAMDIGVAVFAWACILGTYSNCLFFYDRMNRAMMMPHLRFIALLVGLSIPYLLGMMSAAGYCLLVCFASFRVNGSYVLLTLTRQTYAGLDWALVAWIPAIVAVNLAVGPVELTAGLSLQDMLPYLACVHVTLLNLVELGRFLPALRDDSAAAKRTALS